ncbi:crotonase/enoyl-CoA hydratase family protein [Pendulispora rubella]|uniref:Crotonase/enoyl-CoA hydratase family protein n=1 Tax=Pendulispora rubella TaxID=2741070 RepID=A0ABZ2L9Q7_9BACT
MSENKSEAGATTERKITTEKRGHVLLIGLDRPKKMNAFDVDMLRQLGDAFGVLEEDPELRVGVVFAHGDHFTAGLDLANVAPHVTEGKIVLGDGAIDPWGIHGTRRTKPTVIAVHGRCLTLGIELCLAQDIVVAAADTRFAQIEIKRGIYPFGGATFRLVHTAGWGNAMRWLLTGDEFGADEALRIGLVQEVVREGHPLERALAIAETIAAQAPLGVKATLESARRSIDEEAAVRELIPEIIRLMATEDAREGLMSFIERRTARFSGK